MVYFYQDSQDVERKFADLESDLNARISSHEFTKFCEQQSRINHIVDHELRIGRWVWLCSPPFVVSTFDFLYLHYFTFLIDLEIWSC